MIWVALFFLVINIICAIKDWDFMVPVTFVAFLAFAGLAALEWLFWLLGVA